MRICSPVSRCQGNGALARKFYALRNSGCECTGLTGPGLAGHGFSGSSGNQHCSAAWNCCRIFRCIHYIFRFQLRISSTYAERCSLAGSTQCCSQYCSLPGDVLSRHAVGTAGLIFQATGLYKHTLNFSQLNQGEFLAGISLIFLFAAILLCQIFPSCSREIFGRSMSDLSAD